MYEEETTMVGLGLEMLFDEMELLYIGLIVCFAVTLICVLDCVLVIVVCRKCH